MHQRFRFSIYVLLLAVATACNTTTPQKYVEVTVLNTNLVTAYFRPAFFEEIKGNQGNAVDYIQQRTTMGLDQAIEKVEQLEATDETRPLIDASMDVLTYGKQLFDSEYTTVAKMIDDGAEEPAIDSAITQLFEKNGPILDEKLNALDAVAMPYAEKHGIELQAY